MFFCRMHSLASTTSRMSIFSLNTITGSYWVEYIDSSWSTLSDYYSINDYLSFGGLGDKLLAVATNEDPINTNYMNLYYFTGAGISTIASSVSTF